LTLTPASPAPSQQSQTRQRADGGIELERTVADLLTQAAVAGAIRSNVAVGAVMIVLHGIASATDRPLWASEARAAVELLLAGLRTP